MPVSCLAENVHQTPEFLMPLFAAIRKLLDLQYNRNDFDFKRATIRVRGDVLEVHPSYEEFAYRVEFFGDEITQIDAIDPLTGEILSSHDSIFIYPAVHHVMPEDQVQQVHGAFPVFDDEGRVGTFQDIVEHETGQGHIVEAQHQGAQRHLGLQPRQVGAQAVVDARAELHVLVGVGSVDPDTVGLGPAGGVVVGRPDAQVQHIARRDRAIAQHHRLDGDARSDRQRCQRHQPVIVEIVTI
jgi:hypothetical protein